MEREQRISCDVHYRQLRGEYLQCLELLICLGRHPGELRARGPIRCFPFAYRDSTCAHLLFTRRDEDELAFLGLHLARCPTGEVPRAAYDLAHRRLTVG
jgi:hypothetical protein